jgi:hypothetical protein
MKNFQKWKSKKIVFVISDPGSANVILSIVKKFKLKKINFYFTNLYIKKYFKNYKNKFLEYNSLKNLIKINYFNLGVIGTGHPAKYIHLANYLKIHKVLTIAILDHWLNFLTRFKNSKAIFKPNIIFMTHKINYPLNSFFAGIKIINIKNYYLEEKILEIKKIKKIKYDCCYINDPASYIVNKRARKKLITDSMDSFISFLKNHKIKKVLIRPHPKDKILSLEKMIKKIVKKNKYMKKNLIVSKTKNISKDIGSSNAIFGMKSFGLFISLQTKKRVYCFQKNNSSFKLIKKSDQL